MSDDKPNVDAQAQALALAHRIVEAARALVADPNNMDIRRAYMSRVFNLDRAAAAWIALAEGRPAQQEGPEAQGALLPSNDFGWALAQMRGGARVRLRYWERYEHIRLGEDRKEIVDEDGYPTRFRDNRPLLALDWEIAP